MPPVSTDLPLPPARSTMELMTILESTLTSMMTTAARWWHPLWCVDDIDVGVGCCRGVSVGHIRGSSQRRRHRSLARSVGIMCDRFAGLFHTELPWLRRMYYHTVHGGGFDFLAFSLHRRRLPRKTNYTPDHSKVAINPTRIRLSAAHTTCTRRGIISPLGPGHGHDRCRHNMHDALR